MSKGLKEIGNKQTQQLTSAVNDFLQNNIQKFPHLSLRQGKLKEKLEAAVNSAFKKAMTHELSRVVWKVKEPKRLICLLPLLDLNISTDKLHNQINSFESGLNHRKDKDGCEVCNVLDQIPHRNLGIQKNVTVEFFKLSEGIDHSDLLAEYDKRGLTPDPRAQIQINNNDQKFSWEHRNGTVWVGKNKKKYYLLNLQYAGGVIIYLKPTGPKIIPNFSDWEPNTWFGGTRIA